MRTILCLILLLGLRHATHAADTLAILNPTNYYGMCDASAGVAVSSNRFIVANDEDNVLRVYDADLGGPPLQEFPLDTFLEVEKKSPEADIEAVATIGNRLFWIGSHGRNQEGKRRENRCRFFATDIAVQGGLVTLIPTGRPCKTLLREMLREPALSYRGLAEASRRTPKEPGALDIEGLVATSEGSLLIGFRNPIPNGKALLIPLENPQEVIFGRLAKFGRPLSLDLGGLGVRDIVPYRSGFLVIGGPYDSSRGFRLYRWAGPGKTPEQIATDSLAGYNPEALLVYPERPLTELQLLSDDGSRKIDDSDCKQLKEPMRRVFRGFWLAREQDKHAR